MLGMLMGVRVLMGIPEMSSPWVGVVLLPNRLESLQLQRRDNESTYYVRIHTNDHDTTVYEKDFALSPTPSLPLLLFGLHHRPDFPANDVNVYESFLVLPRVTVIPHNAVGLLHRHRHESLDTQSTIDKPSPLQIDNRLPGPRNAILLPDSGHFVVKASVRAQL
jgi:hypothetical protein